MVVSNQGGAGSNQENARLQREVAGLHSVPPRTQSGYSGALPAGSSAGPSSRNIPAGPSSSNLSGGAWLHQHQG